MPEWQKNTWEKSKYSPEIWKKEVWENAIKDVRKGISRADDARHNWNEAHKKDKGEAELWLSDLDSSMPWTEKELKNSTIEQLRWAQEEIRMELKNLQEWKNNIPIWSLLGKKIQRREEYLNKMLNEIGFILSNQSWESIERNKVLGIAKKYLWIHEDTWWADKFLMGQENSAKETPWCAGFVSYVLQESWYHVPATLSSKKFIGESGLGHVAFYAWNGQILWWNQNNQVSIADISRPVKWWIMPEELEAWKPPHKWGIPSVWAIVVFDRSDSDHNVT